MCKADMRTTRLAACDGQGRKLYETAHALRGNIGDGELTIRGGDALFRFIDTTKCAECHADVELRSGQHFQITRLLCAKDGGIECLARGVEITAVHLQPPDVEQ